VPAVAKKTGIAEQTIYNWKNQALNGALTLEEVAASPVTLNAIEKYGAPAIFNTDQGSRFTS